MTTTIRTHGTGDRARRGFASRYSRTVVATLAATMVATSCGTTAHRTSAGLPPAPPVVTVSMREYAFDFDPSVLHRGRVVFKMVNDGRLVHRMMLVPLSADFPPIDAQLKGQDRRVVEQAVEIRNLEPAGPGQQHGMTESFAFDLAPGRYAFLCLYTDPDGVSHANKGMAREFRIP